MGGPGPFVAVVDDESTVRAMLARHLRIANYQVSLFESGPEFLASLNEHSPACAVIDIHMLGLTGLEVQSRMRDAHIRVPVVLITASDEPEFDRAATEAGAVALLRKPFSGDELLKAVELAIQTRSKGEARS